MSHEPARMSRGQGGGQGFLLIVSVGMGMYVMFFD